VLAMPNFAHIQKRAAEMRRTEFENVRWLTADLSAAPNYTLDAIGEVVSYEGVNLRGMLIVLKLSDWNLAEHIPDYIQRIREWGFQYVKARQLAYNRQEICVAAVRRRSMRREPPWKKKRSR